MKSTQQDQGPTEAAIAWLVRLQSPELTAIEQKQFFAWLEASCEHQQAYIEAEELFERLDVVEVVSASNEELIDKSSTMSAPRRWSVQALAASIVLLCGLVLALLWDTWDIHTYNSVVGERRQVILSDGSQLMLNTDSQVRVKTLRNGEPRMMYLDKGEVFFDVVADKNRPFIVQTKQGLVRVLGTQFAVRTTDSDSWVTVVEGKVAIVGGPANETNDVADSIVIADQRLSVRQAVTGVQPATVDAVALTSWQYGKLVYNGVSFAQVVKDLNRYFDGELLLGDDTLKPIKMVAVLEISDKDSTIKALETAFNVVAVQRSNDVTVFYPQK